MWTLGSTRNEDSHRQCQLMAYRLSRLPYANQIVLQLSQVFDRVGPVHTDQQKVRKLDTGRVPASSSPMINSVNWGILGPKLSFFLLRVSNLSYLEDGLVPTFIGSSSGLSERIFHVTFLSRFCMLLFPTSSCVVVAHVLGHISPCFLFHFLRIDRSTVDNILFE